MLTALFQQLLSMALTALPVMAVVLAARWLLRRAPKKYTCYLWAVVAFRLICPVSIASPWSLYSLWKGTDSVAMLPVGNTTFSAVQPFEPVQTPTPAPPFAVTPGAEVVQVGPSSEAVFLQAAAMTALAGTLAILLYLAFTTWHLRRRLGQAVCVEEGVWACDGIPTPFVLGLLRPKIYIPFRMAEAERRYILAHERYHIRRGDPWAKLLGLLLLALYWWNPVMWLCWVLFCRDMEMRCDEAVLEQLGDEVKREYSLSLVSFALEHRAPMALAFGEHDAAKRVKNVLQWKRARPAAVFLAVSAVILVAAVCGTNAAGERNRVTMWMDETGAMAYQIQTTEEIRSWALYVNLYNDGQLIGSDYRVLDGFADRSEGVSTRDFTTRLRWELETGAQGTYSNALTWSFASFGKAEFYETLPKEAYTGMAWVTGDGSGKHSVTLTDGGEVLLGSLLLSARPDGALTVESAQEPLYRLNDTVLQFRLLLSTAAADDLPIRTVDLAQTLFDLRMSRKDASGIRSAVMALGGRKLGAYRLDTDARAVELAFEEPLSDADETRLWWISQVLLALVTDAEEIRYSCPSPDGQQYITYYCEQEQGDTIARNLGYGDIKALGETAEGIRALLAYLDQQGSAPEQPKKSRPFAGILGYSGFVKETETVGDIWSMWTYYAEESGQTFPIADSFGFTDEPQDTVADLDGDGVTELIANVQYGADGATRAYVYQRRADGIYCGSLSPEELEDFRSNGGVNDYWSEYDPAEGVFRLWYNRENAEKPGLVESRDLSGFTFTKYNP